MSVSRRYRLGTPLGPLTAAFSDRGLAGLSFGGAEGLPRLDRRARSDDGARGDALCAELSSYFRTGSWRFSVELDLSSGTDFDRAVWEALRRIPAGHVRTYGEVARSLGRSRAARAVGNACGRNPVAIIVPCHRVVAAAGPGGFGAGLDVKRRLLALEGTSV